MHLENLETHIYVKNGDSNEYAIKVQGKKYDETFDKYTNYNLTYDTLVSIENEIKISPKYYETIIEFDNDSGISSINIVMEYVNC